MHSKGENNTSVAVVAGKAETEVNFICIFLSHVKKSHLQCKALARL